MANANRPSGLSPVQYLNGSSWNGQARLYYVPSTDNNAFAIGDPVVFAGDADANGVPSVTLATAGTTNLVTGPIIGWGTAEGLMADPTNLNTTIIPASKSKAYYLMIVDDPNVIFECQETNSGTAFTSASAGLNTSLKSGTNNGFVSGWTLDNATGATTAALQLKLLGLARRIDNAFGLAAKWLVLINNHSFRTGVAGV